MKEVLLYTTDKAPALAEVRDRDGRVTQVFTRNIFVAQLPDSLDTGNLSYSTAAIPSELGGQSQLAVDAWRRFQRKLERRSFEGFDARANISWNSPGFTAPRTFARPMRQTLMGVDGNVPTSKYMIGSIAVGIVIVSGPGALAFTRDEVEVAVAEVQQALQFLSTAESRAKIRFDHDVKVVDVTAAPGPLTDEESAEAPWRNAALTRLGCTPSISGSVQYVNRLRNTMGTDWAYVAFFTKYNVGYPAYTTNERIVLNFHNAEWRPDYINNVFVHETCHVFGAGDEYSPCNCGERFGYLDVLNSNCNICSGVHYACIMEDTGYELCPSTRQQIGWDERLYPH